MGKMSGVTRFIPHIVPRRNAGFEPATSLSQAQWRHEQEVNYFGDFSGLCAPISGHRVPSVLISETPLQNVRSKNGRIYRALLARPKRFELLTPRFVVWCSPI
jgi:hypothetical protein